MRKIRITSGSYTFVARLEEEKSPETCKWFLGLLPYEDEMIHVSWSGNACFVRLEEKAFCVPFENPIRIPSKGEIIVYPGNIPWLQMGGELFLSWGESSIACQNGNLMGNMLMTIIEGNEKLEEFGQLVHLKGAQTMLFERLDEGDE